MLGITLILFIYGSRWHRYARREGETGIKGGMSHHSLN